MSDYSKALAIGLSLCATAAWAADGRTSYQIWQDGAARLLPVVQSSRFAHPKSRQEILDEQLYEAVSNGSVADVHRLVRMGADPNYQGHSGPLLGLAAAILDDASVVDGLLEEGADVNAKGPCGDIALHDAANSHHLDSVKSLLAHHSSVDVQNCVGQTPLFLAVSSEDEPIVSYLLTVAKADPNIADSSRDTPLMWLVKIGPEEPEVYAALLADPRTNVNLFDAKGMTALKLAVQAKRVDIVRLLLNARGIDVNNNDGGVTALYIAKVVDSKPIIDLLIHSGARD